MHREILSEEQILLFPLLELAHKKGYYLAWGTAIALHLWHRKSIDFDLFSSDSIVPKKVQSLVSSLGKSFSRTIVSTEDELTGIIDRVKVTFLYYPFPVESPVSFGGIVNTPELLTLAAMKAYTLGRRAKWKDYVDLYFLLREYFSISEISERASEIFQGAFNEKLFREQLHYFDGIDYSEQVEYCHWIHPNDEEIREYLRKTSLL